MRPRWKRPECAAWSKARRSPSTSRPTAQGKDAAANLQHPVTDRLRKPGARRGALPSVLSQRKDPHARHKFKVGQSVRLSAPTVNRGVAGIYKVVALLPEERGDWQYRIQSTGGSQQRIAWQSQLSRCRCCEAGWRHDRPAHRARQPSRHGGAEGDRAAPAGERSRRGPGAAQGPPGRAGEGAGRRSRRDWADAVEKARYLLSLFAATRKPRIRGARR